MVVFQLQVSKELHSRTFQKLLVIRQVTAGLVVPAGVVG